jgi:sugar phosphate permease
VSRTSEEAPSQPTGPATSQAVSGQRGPYRWVVVAIIFVVLTLNMGAGFYALTAYTRTLVSDNGLTLSAASAGATVFLLSSGLAGLSLARLLGRFSIRSMMVVGLLTTAATMPLLGLVHSGGQAAVVYLLMGLSSCFWSMVPGTTLITQWFGRDEVAKAMAIAATGLSVGGVAVLPVYSTVIDAVGLTEAALLYAALLVFVLLPLVVVLVRPPRTPLQPDVETEIDAVAGEDAAQEAVEEGRNRPSTGRAQSRRYVFFVLCVGFGLALASQVAVITHLLTLAKERDIPDAALAMSVMAFTAIVGRLAGIPVLPRVGLWRFTIAMESLQAVAMVVIATATTLPHLLFGLVLLGIPMGNNVLLIPLWVVEAFGTRTYTRTYARLMFLSNFLTAMTPSVLGVLHDSIGSYRIPVLIMAGGSAVAAVLLGTLREGRRPRPSTTADRPAPRTAGAADALTGTT